ncbi:MAG: HD domain-containing protein, partial [Campylobacteraceae bacterium]|nr:HD domain-containing protein [Campylobacteraceae bacterium]
DKQLEFETISQIGSFLDMSGAFLENIDKNSEMIKNYLELLNFTNKAMELENIYYKNHSLIVQMVSVEVAKSLFLTQEEIDIISLGAYLHDIGMVGDLLAVLDSDDFGEKEMDLIKEHPLIGSIMVEPICHIYPVSDIIKYHHERFDGKGYPFGLKESQIPMGAQVVSLGEFYAGVTGDRTYKKGKSHEEAIEEIKKLKNKMFNSVVVDVFLDAEKSIKTKIVKIRTKKKEKDEFK